MPNPDPEHWFLGSGDVPRTPHYTGGNAAEALIDGAAYMGDLARHLPGLGEGDELHLAGWHTAPSQRLRPDESGSPTLAASLRALSARGVRVRTLLWDLPVPLVGTVLPQARDNAAFARAVQAGGGEAVLDGRLPRHVPSSHHQKAVVLRSGSGVRAYVGGIDLCEGRWDTSRHAGHPARMGSRFAAWHDVQCAVRGEAAAQVWDNFTERWNDSTPPRLFDRVPRPISTARPREGVRGGQFVQLLRTLAPGVYPFAPWGEQSVALAYERAIERARHLIYIEDQFIWPSRLTGRLRDAAARGVQVILVTSRTYEVPGLSAYHNALQHDTLQRIRSRAPGRVHVFHLRQASGHAPIHLHAKVMIVDDALAVIGSANLSRRSHTTDSELALAVVDGDLVPGRVDGRRVEVPRFARDLRLALWGEHLGLDPATLDDPIQALAAWPSLEKPAQVHHAALHHTSFPRLRVPRIVPALMNP